MSSVLFLKRVVLLLLGMFLMAFGIAALVCAGVGTTPISTLPLVVSNIFDTSLGMATFWVNVGFVVLQVLILRKHFRIYSLVQIPLVFLFGFFIDLCMGFVGVFFGELYWVNLALSVFANVFLALGILALLLSNISMMPGEGFVLAVSVVTEKDFGSLKIGFDVSMVCLSAVLGWTVLAGPVGIREGTLISALTVGWLVRRLSPFVRPAVMRFLQ